MTEYSCCNEERRKLLAGRQDLNGIDFLEVDENNQCQLDLYFVNDLQQGDLNSTNFLIHGGERVTNISVTNVTRGNDPRQLILTVSTAGDFSTYTLSIVTDSKDLKSSVPKGYDRILSAIKFSFKVGCPSDFDCKTECSCPAEIRIEPEIDYLAKDYSSFRQLMLDRMALLSPQWQERNPADIGIALVELLAYVGDHLSYEQDAIGTEAYLQTARRRVSIRRHARLVDYFMHDGCNARAWVYLAVNGDNVIIPQGMQLFTRTSISDTVVDKSSPDFRKAMDEAPQFFETMDDNVTCFKSHNRIKFYTYGDESCCIPKGATQATLLDDTANPLHLKPGDVLMFEELIDPKTGDAAEKDVTHRHAVRLTKADPDLDPLTHDSIIKIQWFVEDALPFPLCINAVISDENNQKTLKEVSVARGNIVLVDHGSTIDPQEQLTDGQNDAVPERAEYLTPVKEKGGCRCEQPISGNLLPRFRPQLKQYPLTQTGTTGSNRIDKTQPIPLFDSTASASSAFIWKMEDVIPAIILNKNTKDPWFPKRDLLSSGEADLHFVVEVEENGIARLRFGDNMYGKAPDPDTSFNALYRVGNGAAGNVAAESIVHVIDTAPSSLAGVILQVRNMLPAKGGVDPESIEHVRQCAPYAYLSQERAVTEDDYAEKALLYSENDNKQLQAAKATFRWTGSWHTVFISLDPIGRETVDDTLRTNIKQFIERYRMAGVDVEAEAPVYVSIEIVMRVCVGSNHFRADVEKALCEIFNSSVLPDGRRGIFHPDNFSFGQTIYLSPLYQAALAVEGVDSVLITTFQRQYDANSDGTGSGKLEMGRLEIPRLDNDPNFPDHGTFTLIMQGGK